MTPNPPQTLIFGDDGQSQWFGMSDYRLIAPCGRASLDAPYVGEPPHGDSYHRLVHDGRTLPGWVWGDHAAFSADGRYFVAGWMEHLFERATVVLDLERYLYCRLPEYMAGPMNIQWPVIVAKNAQYSVADERLWQPY